jgi:hypothetical protein
MQYYDLAVYNVSMVVPDQSKQITHPPTQRFTDAGSASPPEDVDDGSFDDNDGDDEPNFDPSRWRTVATYWNSGEVHIARLKLESEDIPCVIIDENLISTDWLYANAAGGIKLQVPEELLAQAAAILQNRASQVAKITDGNSLNCCEPVNDGTVLCPKCGSDQHYPQRVSRNVAILSMFLLGAPLPFLSRKHRCAACGFTWKP